MDRNTTSTATGNLNPPSTMSSPRPTAEIEITIISAKHLKNVNWRHGDLKPYLVAYLDPNRRSATKPDDSGSTRPVWNERLLLPLPPPSHPSSPLLLTLDVFHSKPSETPKPLVGTASSALNALIDVESLSAVSAPIRTLELRRPSGRPQGKVRFKLAIHARPYTPEPIYSMPPPSPYNHTILPSVYNYPDPYSYYSPPSGYYHDRASGYGLGPSAPVDYSSVGSYEQRQRGGNVRFGSGFAVGGVVGALGGLALEEGKIVERAEGDHNDY